MSLTRSRARTRGAIAIAVVATTAAVVGTARATTYTDATGDNWGPAYVDLASVNVTNDASNITFQLTLNPAANLDDPNQQFADYEIGFNTAAGGSTALTTPYSNQIGISTGMNYWIGAFSSTPGAQMYHWNGSSWDLVAGFGTSGPFLTVARAANVLTVSAPMASFGFSTGNQFNFDVWSTFGNPGGQGAYDALDNPTQTSQPFSPVVAYDAATATGSTYSTTTYTIVAPPPPAWITDADGDWNVGTNWSGGVVPNAIGAEADLFGAITAPRMISTATPITLGTLRFNNTNAYAVGGTGSLTLQVASGSGLIDVQAGSHTISLPLTIASNSTINVATGSTLTLSGAVIVNTGESLGQSGSGTVSYQSSVDVQTGGSISFGNGFHSTGLTLEGTATATAIAHGSGAAVNVLQFDTLSVAGGAKFNLTNNELITTSTLTAIRTMLAAGQLYTSTAGGGLGYGTAGAGQVKVQFTLLGDTNLDGKVDVTDLGNLASSYGAGSGAVWVQGDTNYDGKVDVTDLGNLASNYGGQLSSGPVASSLAIVAGDSSSATVPEPTALGALCIASALLLARRRRR
jgi:hypothetical protein